MTSLMINTDVLVFKTNLRLQDDLKNIAAYIEAESRILLWNVDMEDRDLVLRVEANAIEASEVIEIVKQAGYYCEELPD